ncbi:hypothetical protein D7V93_10890 [Corallococcus llansteffanensis]|uniref:Uncharacterized protein n=1 Tax=Corallococcus llansteffanensis TaxID=2316731 RepID=A0A3A8PZP6_9BACT|nr:hypothetical protein D7V93_10890 [Corallococcus llansteffanensis]
MEAAAFPGAVIRRAPCSTGPRGGTGGARARGGSRRPRTGPCLQARAAPAPAPPLRAPAPPAHGAARASAAPPAPPRGPSLRAPRGPGRAGPRARAGAAA